MKTKFSRILGVALTIAMVASLFVFAIPAAAQPGNTQWDVQTLPTNTDEVLAFGVDITDFAVAGDGETIYVLDGTGANVYKSTDGGQSFTVLAAYAAAAGVGGVAIAVAPDNPDVVAAVDSSVNAGFADGRVYFSTDAGLTWSALPLAIGTTTDTEIRDVAVSQARSGAVLSRDYAIALADNTTAGLDGGIIYDTNGGAAWVNRTGLAADFDFVAVAFSPHFAADRTVIGVGCSDGAAADGINAAAGAAGVSLYMYNQQAGAAVTGFPTVIAATPLDYGAAGTDTFRADIALPSDFDPGLLDGQRTYVGFTDVGANDAKSDVYRIDAITPKDLDAGIAVNSIAYSGTIEEGILFCGADATTNVRYTTNMTVSSPTWKSARKVPTGTNAANTTLTVVRLASGSATTTPSEVFAGTTGAESAFSMSTNYGVSYDGLSLIDSVAANTVVNIDAIALTPDGGTIFVASDDGTDMMLWKSSTPVSATSWSRIYLRTAQTTGALALNPAWDTDPVLYFINTAAVVNNVFVSLNGGDTFNTRSAPDIAALVVATAVEDNSIVYVAHGNVIYKSVNAGYIYGLAVAGNAGAIISMVSPIADHVLVGGTGACSYSIDGGSSFTQIASGLPALVTFTILADEDYATNNIIYAGGNNAIIYRFQIGTSTSWENLANNVAAGAANTAIQGMAMNNGVLYSCNTVEADRTLGPHDPSGMIVWRQMDQPVAFAPVAASFDATNNTAYAASALDDLWAYNDPLATAVPVATSPTDGYSVAIDPVVGRAELTTLAWNAMGSGTGLVNVYDVSYTEKALGWSASIVTTTGAGGIPNIYDATAPQIDTASLGWTLNASTEYMWRVRASDQVSGDTLVSAWSDGFTLTIQAGGAVVETQYGPLLQGPVGGATNVSLNPGFSWAPIFGATEYEFILATDATLTNTVEDTPVLVTQPSWQVPAGTLEYDTQYFWAVKATQPTESPQSIGTFRTMISELYACPFCSETFTTAGALESHISAMHPAATPAYIWAIIVIGAVLMIAVIMLIVKTRRVA